MLLLILGDKRIIAVGKVIKEFYEEKDKGKYIYDTDGWHKE